MAFEYIWLTDKLKGEYKEAFDKVEIYANVRNIDEVTQNDMLMELLDLFLTAQAEEKPVSKLVGSDLESFCNSFFSSYSMKTYLRSLPQKIYRFCWMILVLELIFYFGSEEEISLLHGTVDVSGYLCGIAVGVFDIWSDCCRGNPFRRLYTGITAFSTSACDGRIYYHLHCCSFDLAIPELWQYSKRKITNGKQRIPSGKRRNKRSCGRNAGGAGCSFSQEK